MLSVIKDHIISKITGLEHIPFLIRQRKLSSLLKLNKYDSGEVTLLLPKDKAESIIGTEFPVCRIESDYIISKVFEDSITDSEKNLCFSINKKYFMKHTLLYDDNSQHRNENSQHVLVEFSSPNIAKPFHIGHLRSTVVGNFVANCAERKFGRATRLNYLGDWGAQVGYIKAGLDDMGISNDQLYKDPVKVLYEAYVKAYNTTGTLEKAKSIFSELEQDSCSNDQKDFWKNVRLLTVNNLKETYLNLGIKFDEFCYESDYRITRIKELLRNLEACGIAKKRSSDGLLVLCPSSGIEIPLIREDGTSLYLSRDIAAAMDRLDRYKDCSDIFYVVDKSQVGHFQNVAEAILALTGKDVIKHIHFGRVTGVSSRKGTTLLLQDILNKAIKQMAQQQHASKNSRTNDPDVTRILAVTTLMVYILKQARCRDFVFNWDIAMQGKGDSGVKLQYTHSRLCSLEKKCGVSLPSSCEPNLLEEPILAEIVLEIARSEEVMQSSVDNFESSFVVKYLFSLCNLISRSLSQVAVKGQPTEIAQQRLLVYHKARLALARSMKLLGLQPLVSM